MRPKACFLALWLALISGLILVPDYAHPSGPMLPESAPAAPAAPATPPPARVKPVQPRPGTAAPPRPGAVTRPRRPAPPAVPSKNAVIRAQMIAQIKTKYAQRKSFITAKYLKERGKILSAFNKLIQNRADYDPIYRNQYNLINNQAAALEEAYHGAIQDLDRSRDAQIRGVYQATDRLR